MKIDASISADEKMKDGVSVDVLAIELARSALDEVFSDRRFFIRKSLSPAQIADYVFSKIRSGERDLTRLKTSIFKKIAESNDGIEP